LLFDIFYQTIYLPAYLRGTDE